MKKLEIAKRYEVILKCDQLLVTGSTALRHYGLTDKIESDLDLVLVNPTEEALSVLKSMQEAYPARSKPYEGGSVAFIFKHKDVKIDIFIRQEKLPNPFELGGVKLDSIKNIVKAKQGMGRLKDYAQLRMIARSFFKQEVFENFLNQF